MPLTGHVWLCEKKEGLRPERRVVAETQPRAEEWLERQCEQDPDITDYRTRQYSKVVYYDQDDNVVGSIRRVRTKIQYEQQREKFRVTHDVEYLKEREAGVLGEDES